MADTDKRRENVEPARHGGTTAQRYLDGDYAGKNPAWDMQDSPWKAGHVWTMLDRNGIRPARVVEIGCGAGGVLAELRRKLPAAELHGFDIAPAAAAFWPSHAACRIEFTVGDFLESNRGTYDLILMLDVVEHLENPFSYLERLRGHGAYFVFHFPLDLSALSVLREDVLLHVRDRMGHIHYYTRGLALALLRESGYEILDWSYTGAAFNAPQRSWKTRVFGLARRLAYAVRKDAGVRLLGGETLLVLARPLAAA